MMEMVAARRAFALASLHLHRFAYRLRKGRPDPYAEWLDLGGEG